MQHLHRPDEITKYAASTSKKKGLIVRWSGQCTRSILRPSLANLYLDRLFRFCYDSLVFFHHAMKAQLCFETSRERYENPEIRVKYCLVVDGSDACSC